jgi:starch phosphorylase
MVREYVERLYAPASRAQRAVDPRAARQLASWKAEVRRQWGRVAIGHVQTGSAGGTPELGSSLALRVRVALGDLDPRDVDVQVVAGRVDESDRIADPAVTSLKPAGRPDLEGRWLYEGRLSLDRTGPFGYTVRVLPAHPLLASPAELGLITVPADPVGMTAGLLR